MAARAGAGAVKRRRAELNLTQQEAARRADVSLATWRRFENGEGDTGALDGFRGENVRGFARALKLTAAELRRSVLGAAEGAGSDADGSEPLDFDRHTDATVKMLNAAFTDDRFTPADAMALATTVVFTDFAPTVDGRFHLDSALGCGFPDFLKGEATIRDVELLRDLPEFVLTQVNNHWLVRMGERIMRVASKLHAGRIPRPVCLADEYALTLVIFNSEPPQLSDLADMYPGLRDAVSALGYDPDFDDPEDEEDGRLEWMNRMVGALLPPEESHGFRRYDLTIMEKFGQGVYDPTDPRHPLRWFDRDDLRDQYDSNIAFVRLSKEEQDGRTREALDRMSLLFAQD